MEADKIVIGRLLRAQAGAFVAGTRVEELESHTAPLFGALCRVEDEERFQTYGLIGDITIADDGMVRQLVSVHALPQEYASDNRYNRNLPVEVHVLTVGFAQDRRVLHRLPPRPPLSLDALYLCDRAELVRFTSKLGYLRHLLRVQDQPVEELLTAHLALARVAHEAAGDVDWYPRACQEIIVLLRDDYGRLANVLNALAELE